MKRAGFLMEKIADLSNLYLAYYKAKKGKGQKPNVVKYGKNLHSNILKLREQIFTNTVEIGNYHYFTIYDPKERVICAAPFEQRLLHHAIMNICHPYFEQHQIFDSYASRLGKGTFAALARARQNNGKYKWFLKLDFRKYFNSIDHEVLKNQLARLFKDKQLLVLYNKIIESYTFTPHKGVPIGNLTSQYFANHYLATADHYIKENLQAPAYVRYMDDMVLWHNDKDKLLETGFLFQQFTESELKLTLKPFCLNENRKGLPFLGFRLHGSHIRLSPRSKQRFIKKSKNYFFLYQEGFFTEKQYQQHVTALTAFTEHAYAANFRRRVYNQIQH